jgi:DNA-binding Lrp family transcriptional regulator
LTANPKASLSILSQELGISLTAVSKRIKKLEEEEIIQYNICINIQKIKMAQMTILIETTDSKSRSQLIKNFGNCPLVYQIYEIVGGQYHLLMLLISEDESLLNNFVTYCPISYYEGIKKIISYPILLDPAKTAFIPLVTKKSDLNVSCGINCTKDCSKFNDGCPGCPTQEYTVNNENTIKLQNITVS